MGRATRLPIAESGFEFDWRVAELGQAPLRRATVTTLQINVGKRCNMACHHCHVDAGPKRTEVMQKRISERLLQLLEAGSNVDTVDLTGGAPELNPNFRTLVSEARRRGLKVIDRCNLSVLFEPGMEDLAAFLAEQRVEIIASLPCYSQKNVDAQRGKGAFDKSVRALERLNELGYGQPGSGRSLNLVYNPGGAFLPPSQDSLEQDYRQRLADDFGVRFNHLLTITNMPIARFAHSLLRDGKLSEYMSLLVNHFNPGTLDGLMCRSMVSVSYDGLLYDCDFNQMLELPVAGVRRSVWDIESFSQLQGEPIKTASHCFGCTAGAGSSCSGALS